MLCTLIESYVGVSPYSDCLPKKGFCRDSNAGPLAIITQGQPYVRDGIHQSLSENHTTRPQKPSMLFLAQFII